MAPQCPNAVAHVLEAGSPVLTGDVEAGTVVLYLEAELATGFGEADRDRCIGGVLGGVLQRLWATEVDGRLDLGRVAACSVGAEARLGRRLVDGRAKGTR